jgi:hypothetical protein
MRKFFTTLGENCDEYVVNTTIVVVNVKTVIVINAPAITPKIVLESSTLVNIIGGRWSLNEMYISESKSPTPRARAKEKILITAGVNQKLSFNFFAHLLIILSPCSSFKK